jgi:ABC-2 type transport system permease protein
MFLNDIIWVIFWFIFFTRFPTINAWGFGDMMTMMAVITTSWGLVGVFFGNFRFIAEVIREGQLDFYLTLPKEELTHILVSKSKFDAFGDVMFGIILALFFIPLANIPLYLVLILLSCTIILGFAIILGSLSFFIGSSTEVSNQGLMGILSIASYPFSSFEGYTKFILLTIIPAGFITGIPVELLKLFNLKWFLLMVLCAALIFIIAVIIFKLGVRRYESGNLINVRM